MALKGNLLYNGDFETGTTEGWLVGPFGLRGEYTLEAFDADVYEGSYSGKLIGTANYAQGYIMYDKVCSFEEYEAFLYFLSVKMVTGFYATAYLYGLDDKGNLVKHDWLGYNNESGEWRTFQALVRGFGQATHFAVGCLLVGVTNPNIFVIDGAKLIPLKSVKSHELVEDRTFENVTTTKEWYSILACLGRCKLRSIVRTENVSGSSPTLDININIGLFGKHYTCYSLKHSQFTGEDFEEKTIDLPEVCWIGIKYTLGGSSPSFDIHHHLRVEAY